MQSKVYVISDTHFGHANIIKYCDRPFNDADQMDSMLIKNWNEIITPDDIVWHLGDFALKNKEKTINYFRRLNGRKMLVLGNHDIFPEQFYRDLGFQYVSRFPIIYDKKIILSHAPIDKDQKIGDFFNIYGHVHNKREEYRDDNSYCVSVENINYRPILINEVLAKIKAGEK